MNELVFNILMALIVAIVGIIAKELLPFIKQKQEELDAQLRKTEWAWAADIVDAVVRAVEQTVADNIHGQDKKDIAIKYINNLLEENGLDYLSDDQINALIEAAVNSMNEVYITYEEPAALPDQTDDVIEF